MAAFKYILENLQLKTQKNMRCRQKFKRSSQGAGITICHVYKVRIGSSRKMQ